MRNEPRAIASQGNSTRGLQKWPSICLTTFAPSDSAAARTCGLPSHPVSRPRVQKHTSAITMGGGGVLLMGVVVNSFRKQPMPRLDTRASGRPGHSPWAYPNRWKVPGSQDRLDLHLLPTGLPASHWAPPSRPAGKLILPWPEGRVSVGRPEERAIWLSTSRSSGVRSLIRGIPWASNGSSS